MRIISINDSIKTNNNAKINFGWGDAPKGSNPKLRVYPKESLPLMEQVAFSNLQNTEKADGTNLLKQVAKIFKKK